MQHPKNKLLGLGMVALLSGCAWFRTEPKPPPPPPTPPPPAPLEIVTKLRLESAAELTTVDVQPLTNPAVQYLRDRAIELEAKGDYAAAAKALTEAVSVAPEDPEILQHLAEEMILLRRFVEAEAHARKSFEMGAQLGPLCSANWRTIAAARKTAGDLLGHNSALERAGQCAVKPLPRF